MKYIWKREFWAYFTQPTGYIFLGITGFVTGMLFIIYNLIYGIGDFFGYFQNIQLIFLLIVPILTMRLLSEDRKSKVEQLLYTSPLSIGDVVLGKFLAAISIFAILEIFMCSFPLILAKYTKISAMTTLVLYLGFFLQAMSLISVGMVMSSLTEHQMAAAVSGFFVMLIFYLSDWIAGAFGIGKLLAWISPMSRFQKFTIGLFDVSAVVFYLTFTIFCLLLTKTITELKKG